MEAKDQTQYVKAQEHYSRLTSELLSMTPLAMMLHGYGTAAKNFSINNIVVEHLHQAALAQARALQDLSHETAAIWIEPLPLSPVSAAIKVEQTQSALRRHLEASTEDSLLRFGALQASARDILKAD